MSKLEEPSQGLVTFDDTLDITMVSSYFEQFSQMLNQYKAIILDAENVERIDGAGLQLLVAFIQAAERLQISVQWQGYSETVKKSAKISGVAGSLGIQ